MSVDRWIGLLGLLMTAVGTWVALRERKSSPRIVAEVRTTPLFVNRSVQDLSVSWHGEHLSKPVLVEFTVWNQGPGDIPISAFEGGHVRASVPGTAFVGLTSEGATRGVTVTPAEDGVLFELPPQLLKHREGGRATAVCDGRPDDAQLLLRLSGVKSGRSADSVRWRAAFARSFALYLIVSGLILISTLLGGGGDDPAFKQSGGWLGLVMFLTIFLFMGGLGGAYIMRASDSANRSDRLTETVDFGSPRANSSGSP